MFIRFVAAMGGLLFGYDTIVMAGTQEQVTRQFQLASAMQGQFTTMAIIGCLVGVAITILLGDCVSRKGLLILSSLLLLIGAIGCGLARSATELFWMRWLGGEGVEVASVLSPLYITKTAPPHLRGRLVTVFPLMINLGLLAAAFPIMVVGIPETKGRSLEELESMWMRGRAQAARPAHERPRPPGTADTPQIP